MSISIKLDEKQATLLGFCLAGWDDYKLELESHGVTVYTTSKPIIDENTSIYWSSHQTEDLEKKAQQKIKDPASVGTALMHVFEMLMLLKEPESREQIVKYVLGDVCRLDDVQIKEAISEIELDAEPTSKMIELLYEATSDSDPDFNCDDGRKIDLSGYNLVSIFRSGDSTNVLGRCLKNTDIQFLPKLKEWVQYVNLETKPIDMQITLARSKSMIVDTLQKNLMLLKEDKSLIPICFIVEAEGSTISQSFIPDWNKAIRKVSAALTNAEIRMTYKLMKEINDPLVNELMEKTVFFFRKTENGFEEVPAPWAGNIGKMAAKDIWADRERTLSKSSHRDRSEEQVQQWIKQLRNLSTETAEVINYRMSEPCNADPEKKSHFK